MFTPQFNPPISDIATGTPIVYLHQLHPVFDSLSCRPDLPSASMLALTKAKDVRPTLCGSGRANAEK